MGERKHVRFEREGPLARITLDRPPVNVLDIAAMREVLSCLDEAEGGGAAVVLWRGAGEKGFSAGVEIREHTREKVGEMLETFHAMFRRMARGDAVQVAAVHGFCLGGGCELATFCDMVVAAESATFGQPEIEVGCFPPVAAAYLPAAIGPQRAAEVCLLGRRYTAREAQELGLVGLVVPDGRFEEESEALVAKLQERSPAVLRLTRRALRADRAKGLEHRLEAAERIYLEELMATEDVEEGIAAFLERRKPEWKGR